MKKIITVFIGLLIVGLVFLAGCSEKKIIWKSVPQGDFKRDDRNPREVCLSLQEFYKMEKCSLIEFKASRDKNECADGMSVAGCFSCKFEC